MIIPFLRYLPLLLHLQVQVGYDEPGLLNLMLGHKSSGGRELEQVGEA